MPEQKLGKFDASLEIVKESWAVLRQDKEMVLFPIIGAVVNVLFILGVLYFFFIRGDLLSLIRNPNGNGSNLVGYGVTLVFYLVSFFISYFFQSGVLIIAHARFNGENLSFSDGFNGALNNIGKILALSSISATVGLILNIISEKSKMIGKIIAALFGAAWNILTYFSLPSLIIGKTTVRDSFKDSASVIRKTWGESIIISMGVGFFFFVITIAGLIVAVGAAYLIGQVFAALIIAGLFIVYLIILSIISSTLGIVYKLALYEYAKTGVVPQGFSANLIKDAIIISK